MSAWEGLMWQPTSTRAPVRRGALVEMLDCDPDWDRLVAAHERVSRAIPRLRDRVVEPIAAAGAARPSAGTSDFDVGNHLHRIRLGTGDDARAARPRRAGSPTRPFATRPARRGRASSSKASKAAAPPTC